MTVRRPWLVAALVALAAQPLSAQGFGAAVAVAGTDVLIGEPASQRPGVVFVYRRTPNGAWVERARITASNGRVADRFGGTLAIEADQLVVGAGRGGSGNGGAYVFRRDGRGTWSETGQLTAEVERRDGFGAAVAIGGTWAAVGAPARDSARGAVYLFRREGDRWSAAGQLTPPDSVMPNERFGASLAVRGEQLLVGAPGRDRGTGAAYLYRLDGSAGWRQETRLTVSGMAANARLGMVVALRQDTAVVAAPWVEQFAGALYLFRKDSTGAWVNPLTLRPFDAQRNLRFGSAFVFDGDVLLVGAPGADRFAGALYRYRREASGQWRSAEIVRPAAGESFDQFAATVGGGGDVIVAGLLGDDHGAGTALVLEQDRTGALREAGRVWSEEPGMAAVTGGERRCDGQAAAFGCSNVDLQAFLPISAIGGSRGVRLNDIWGWTDTTTGREYALVGRINGTSFVDVTTPTRPVYLGDLPMTPGARANAWRDIKVYRDHAFIVADGAGQHGMQVFDLTQLRGARPGRPQTFQPVTTYPRIASAHNIVINEESGYAYAVGSSSGGETCGGGLHMIDIRTPTQPTFAGCFSDTSTGRQRTGYSHDAQCVTYRGPDEQYRGREICLGSNETALSIADVTDKARPVAISSATYPNVSYTHQGWLTDDHRHFYMDDEGDESSGRVAGTRTLIWDVSDLDEPVLVGEYIAQVKAIDHNLYVRGNLVFESNYGSGLRVLDITDRARPREVGFLDTEPFGEDVPEFVGTWSNYPFFRSGNVIVSSIGEGLFVVRPRVAPVP